MSCCTKMIIELDQSMERLENILERHTGRRQLMFGCLHALNYAIWRAFSIWWHIKSGPVMHPQPLWCVFFVDTKLTFHGTDFVAQIRICIHDDMVRVYSRFVRMCANIWGEGHKRWGGAQASRTNCLNNRHEFAHSSNFTIMLFFVLIRQIQRDSVDH